MAYAASKADPYLLDDTYLGEYAGGTPPWQNTNGLTPRNLTINTAIRNCVLFWAGQSNSANILPSLYTPVNSAAVDQFNIYDGAFYPIADKLLGCGWGLGGSGHIGAMVADKLITAGMFDR